VGVIVVKDGMVVSRGSTAPGGRPHGEAMALAAAGEAARGATIYVSLEPCAHQGRAGPCADAIIAAGVSRVVAAMTDPDPRTAGRGFERLRAAGVQVTAGILEQDAKRAHAAHLWRMDWPAPYVILKLAVSADDAIGRAGEGQVRVTGAIARRHAQVLRTRFDAILVGRGTVEADDPQLTVRLPGLESRSPVRVVLDTEGRLPPDRRVFTGETPTWIIGARRGASVAEHVEQLISSRSTPGGVDPWVSLHRLKERGVTKVLVEGGASVARRFLESDLVNEAVIFRSPRTLGGEIVPALAGLELSFIEASERFRRIERRRFGADMMTRYERAH
jgi:diaminohydroxyphosphoribosylaminopyrimidine deaminase/5-amino-6-(5-phosphoribosylamino)uracil reductase